MTTDPDAITPICLVAPATAAHDDAVLSVCKSLRPAALRLTDLAGQSRDEVVRLKRLVSELQAIGTAVVVTDALEAAVKLGADGIHLTHAGDPLTTTETRYTAARDRLGADAIVGVEMGETRHDVMVLAEKGASYIAFELIADAARGRERIAWWTEVFEIPCIATIDIEGARDYDTDARPDFFELALTETAQVDEVVTAANQLLAPRAAEASV